MKKVQIKIRAYKVKEMVNVRGKKNGHICVTC